MVRTVNDAYLDLRNQLRMAGIEGYQIEAREIVCYALGIPREQFFDRRGEFVFERDEAKIARFLQQRITGTPVQYITGQWEFYGLPLEVSRDTLIPRPDTEILAETAIELLSQRARGRFLDLCCGTGCIGIAILKNVSDGVVGVFADQSQAALSVARKNIVRHQLTDRAYTVNLDAICQAPDTIGRFNFIACNPPYIPTDDIDSLDPEVRQEPRMALDGGEDGLDFYRAIPRNFKKALMPGGILAFEVGLGQCYPVMDMMQREGFTNVCTRNDMRGIERIVLGMKE